MAVFIKFFTAKAWARSTIWKMDKYDYLRRQYFVTIGGVEGGESVRGSFSI